MIADKPTYRLREVAISLSRHLFLIFGAVKERFRSEVLDDWYVSLETKSNFAFAYQLSSAYQ